MSWFHDKFFAEVSGPLATERFYKRHMPVDHRRRLARHRGDPCGAPQHPLSSRLYRLAGAHARLARRRAAELRRSGRGRAPVGGRLSGRCAVERRRSREELVRAGEVAPVVPSDPGRDAGRACRRRRPTPTSTSKRGRQAQARTRVARARARLRRRRRDPAGRDPARQGPARTVPRRRRPRRHGLDGGRPRARRSARPVARRALRHHARSQLRPRRRSAGDPEAPRPRRHLGLRPGRRLSRHHQAAAQGDRALARRAGRRRGQGVRRHRRRDGEAAGGGRRPRLAGQAHQPGVAPIRLVAVSRRDLHHARSAARRTGRRSLRQLPRLPRRLPDRGVSRRPIGSMRGAASPISPSSTKARSRASCGR